MTEKTTIGVELDSETRDRLKALGAVKDRSRHSLMREAIAQYLEREEAKERERQTTLERWQRYTQTGETVDNDAVSEWIDYQVGRR